jgi:hypothetical protein
MRRYSPMVGTATLAVAAGMTLAPHAVAGTTTHGSNDSHTDRPGLVLADHLVSPLSLAVASNGAAYVTENFAGVLAKVRPGKAPKQLYASSGGNEVGAVSVSHGNVVFAETASDSTGSPQDSWLKRLTSSGKVRTVAHLRAYEDRVNPDGHVTYGARGISDSCAAQWPTGTLGPAVYQGTKDSHPFATWQSGRRTYVADAGMNAIVEVSGHGRIRTTAVLPAVPVPITAELATQVGVPACAVGLTYYGEPVPTDVQRGADGRLYVTTEGGGLGESMPLGALYRIDTGRRAAVTKIADGLFAPVGLAIGNRGEVYVSQLFGNEISVVANATSAKGTERVRTDRSRHHGAARISTFATVNMPASLDWSRGRLYATTDVLVGPSEDSPNTAPGGKVVVYGHR